jgi:2-hydroxy-3-keto-5-methylthiopentenyl-1-phosphate phosphatase
MNNKYVVFFDFDNTITSFDVIDDMLERFSKDDRWIALENKWKKGRIGSRECLKGQVEGIRISRKELDSYLHRVKLDPYFKKLAGFLRSKKIKTVILSDNFDYILKTVLTSNGVNRLPVYSNRLRLVKDRLIPSFPLTQKACDGTCGHCKNRSMRKIAGKGNTLIYIGDGRSDICPARAADIVFAKDALKDYFKSKKLDYIPIRNLGTVYKYFKRSLS